MNERFKKLADSVGLGVRHDGIVLTKNVNAAEAFDQFAQLMVRECATKANAVAIDLRNDPNLNARKYVGDSIIKCFGVEE
jgi:hypothetical protein